MSGTGLSAWHLYPQPMPSPKEVIVIHSDSSEPAPERPHSGIHSQSSRPLALPTLAERSICHDTAAATTVALTASAAANSPASATINPHTPPHPLASFGDEPAQPRYMTRSVVQNATRRKQEQLMMEMQQQAGSQSSGTALPAFTFSQSSHAGSTAAAASAQSNPYSLLAYGQQQQQQQQQQQSSGTWTTSALYQAARAVAAAVNTNGSGQIPQPSAAEKQPKAAPPAKRRKNPAATKAAGTTTAQQRGGRGRATQRTKQQQQKGDASCDDRDGHYIVVPGREFTPRFKIRRLLGQGTFGKVMECEDNSTGRLVAIKVIRAVPKYRDAAKIEIRVLQTLQRNDPTNVYQCMHVNETFDHRNHVCMVFDLLGPSVFDFLKENEFRPFSLHHVQLFAEQLLRSVAFLHSLNLVHTDLKPENILLESGDYDVVPFGSSQTVKTRMLRSTTIRLIDFGSATFNNEYHSQVVSTRHYRAPEIILNLGWSFPCDMWSIGCIILELLTGEALFQTHDNNEHLAMMEVVVGRAPAHITRTVAPDLRAKFFRADGTARYPAPEQTRQSSRGLRSMRPLSQLVNPATNPIYANLHDLLFRLLQYDPQARITAKEACEHPFFRYRVGPDGRLVSRPPSQQQQQQQQQRVYEPQSVGLADLVPSPSSASASLSHHRSFRPSYAVPQPATGPYTYTGANAAAAAAANVRAPLRVGDYSLAAGVAPPQTVAQQQQQQQQQQHPVLPALKAAMSSHHYRDSQMMASPHSPYAKEFSDRPTPQHYYASQPSRAADTYSWQHAAATGAAPQHSSSSTTTTTGYETSGVQPLQQPVRSSTGKRKAGVPVDSGYFPEATSSGEASYFGANSHSGSSITSGAQQQQQQQQPPPPPQSARGYFPPSAPYPPANYAASSAKSSHLPPISTHIYPQQQQYPPSASVTTAGAAVVPGAGMAQQPHHHHPYTNYQQQRHYPFAMGSMNAAGPPSASGNGAMPPVRLLPLDANTTPTLTMATTATPTPNSTSHLSGSHSMENVVPSTAAASGPKSSVRSLPSLVGGNALNPNASHVNSSISSEFARASLKEQQHSRHHGHVKLQHPPSESPMSQQVPGRSSFYHLPPAQTLLQPHQSSSVSSLDYSHHQQFAPPSSANNSSY